MSTSQTDDYTCKETEKCSQKSEEEKKSQQKAPQTTQMLDLVHDNFKITITKKVKNLQKKMDAMGEEIKKFRGDRNSKKGPNENPRTEKHSIGNKKRTG